MKNIFLSLCAAILLASCSQTAESLIGKKYNIGDFIITFETKSQYKVIQLPYNCGGSGTWFVKDEKVILSTNNSRCTAARELSGTYSFPSSDSATLNSFTTE